MGRAVPATNPPGGLDQGGPMRDRAVLRTTYLILSAVLLAACAVDGAPVDGPLGEAREAVCSGVSMGSVPKNSAPAGTDVLWTAYYACQSAIPEFEFWVSKGGGSWSVAAPYSTSSTYTWQVPAVPDGTLYDWEVWA